MLSKRQKIEFLRELLAKDKLEDALYILSKLKGEEKGNVILVRRQLSELENRDSRGLFTREDYSVRKNEITSRLITFLYKLEKSKNDLDSIRIAEGTEAALGLRRMRHYRWYRSLRTLTSLLVGFTIWGSSQKIHPFYISPEIIKDTPNDSTVIDNPPPFPSTPKAYFSLQNTSQSQSRQSFEGTGSMQIYLHLKSVNQVDTGSLSIEYEGKSWWAVNDDFKVTITEQPNLDGSSWGYAVPLLFEPAETFVRKVEIMGRFQSGESFEIGKKVEVKLN